MTPVLRATSVQRAAPDLVDEPQRHVALGYQDRLLRRKRLTCTDGTDVLTDLAETVSLNHGDRLLVEDGSAIGVVAAPETLLRVAGDLPRLAWHIGNRHTPCEVRADHLLIQEDHVLADMLRGLGATVDPVEAPFQPEGGAYGHGRTMGHSHGPHDHHDH